MEMLTLYELIACWTVGAISFGGMVFSLYRRRWWRAALAYLLVGFFVLALPFKIAMASMNWWGALFLTVVWPVWLGQKFGYSMVGWFPLTFWSLLFTYPDQN